MAESSSSSSSPEKSFEIMKRKNSSTSSPTSLHRNQYNPQKTTSLMEWEDSQEHLCPNKCSTTITLAKSAPENSFQVVFGSPIQFLVLEIRFSFFRHHLCFSLCTSSQILLWNSFESYDNLSSQKNFQSSSVVPASSLYPSTVDRNSRSTNQF